MRMVAADLVDILRDYLSVHQQMRRLIDRYRSGDLEFAEVQQLISDDESSVLFRLKERCHASFRPRDGDATVTMRREALFDLAVGSLFHEAMKFRESFYQKDVYGPRVGALRSQSNVDAAAIFEEFEKILDAVPERLEEGLQETEILIAQTGQQLRVLLASHPDNSFALRYMIENPQSLEGVFDMPLDELLAEIEGDAAAAFARAGRSYLNSGFYELADEAFAVSIARGGDDGDLAPLTNYCRGMSAYLGGDYRKSVEELRQWLGTASERDQGLAEIACAALSKVIQLVDADSGETIASDATALAEQLAVGGNQTEERNATGGQPA